MFALGRKQTFNYVVFEYPTRFPLSSSTVCPLSAISGHLKTIVNRTIEFSFALTECGSSGIKWSNSPSASSWVAPIAVNLFYLLYSVLL